MANVTSLSRATQPPAAHSPSLVEAVRKDVKRSAKHVLTSTLSMTHDVLEKSPQLNEALGAVTGPIVKRMFNSPDKPGQSGPAPLQAQTIEQARALMVQNFKPAAGKMLIGISGGGKKTVHSFVVSGIKPDGRVLITQAIAQVGSQPEDYRGIGGRVSQAMDKLLGNQPNKMKGVVEEDWNEYAARAHRNSIVLLEVDADPEKARHALEELSKLVGKPYDHTMLGSSATTTATQQQMYCTEITAWFVNAIRPGTIKPSDVYGFSGFSVEDHLRATDAHGGPLKILFNGENRIDVAADSPYPQP